MSENRYRSDDVPALLDLPPDGQAGPPVDPAMDAEAGTAERPPDGEAGPAQGMADDSLWRLTAWALPAGAGASAALALAQTFTGGLSPAAGYPAALVLTLLCAALVREARRRALTGRWVRAEVYEFALPLVLLLVALFLLLHGASLITTLPALVALLLVGWEIVQLPPVARVPRLLLPRALPVLGEEMAPPSDDGAVERIVRDVLDGLPADIAARLEGWSVEVREELLPRPRDHIVYGMCFTAANVIAIYRRPHLRYHGRGESLRQAVTYTTLHEIAHALGLDETGVRRLGPLAERPPAERSFSERPSAERPFSERPPAERRPRDAE